MHDAYHPHEVALLDCYRSNDATILICHQDGWRDDVAAAFWLRSDIDPLERLALDLCHVRVLDVGTGAGLHSLELQRLGLDVTAIDVAEEGVEIMRDRGVAKALHPDLYDFEGGPIDTILCICSGLDKVGNAREPARLPQAHAGTARSRRSASRSFDVRVGADEVRKAVLARKTAADATLARPISGSNIRAQPASRSRRSRSITKR